MRRQCDRFRVHRFDTVFRGKEGASLELPAPVFTAEWNSRPEMLQLRRESVLVPRAHVNELPVVGGDGAGVAIFVGQLVIRGPSEKAADRVLVEPLECELD